VPPRQFDPVPDPVQPVRDLDVVGDSHDPGGERDRIPGDTRWQSLAVPAGERVLQWVAHRGSEPQTAGEQPGDLAVGGERFGHRAHAGRQQSRPLPDTPQRAAVGSGA
jgi:hypothetical protein